jgi:hypothetical protein
MDLSSTNKKNCNVEIKESDKNAIRKQQSKFYFEFKLLFSLR